MWPNFEQLGVPEIYCPNKIMVDYIQQTDKTPEQLVAVSIGRRPTLSREMEEDLVSYCLEMDRRFCGISATDIRNLAYQIAMKNGLSHPFSRQNENTGKKWLRFFLKRYLLLTFRKPQGIWKARIKGFTPENINRFFDLLEPAMEKINYNPARIYDVDETGITTVQTKTIPCEDLVVLILDGQYSHTRNMDVITTGRRNHVTIICIPPHTFHKMQPIDLSCIALFKTHYS